MQIYTYRPDAAKMLLGLAFFGLGAVFMAFQALTDHKAILIDGLIYLAPGQATTFRWVVAGLCAILSGAALLALGMALFSDHRILVGDEVIDMPKSMFSPQMATIPYRTIRSTRLTTVRVRGCEYRFLKLATARGTVTVNEAKLPDAEAFEAVSRAIDAGMKRAQSAPLVSQTRPIPTAPQAPSRPANPNAPRTFGRRT
jgi:hypothetical protein